nr:ribonuclease H-like domain-containing protein [Tanacetum cinerariifolium]
LPDENHVLLRVPRKKNMYSVDLKNIIPKGGLTCLFAKATSDESRLWHRSFMAVSTPPDDLIRTDFEQEGIVLKVILYIFKEIVLLLGRHSLNNEVPRMEENPPGQSRLGLFLSKEIFEGGVIRIHNAFIHDEDYTYGKVACIAHKLKG